MKKGIKVILASGMNLDYGNHAVRVFPQGKDFSLVDDKTGEMVSFFCNRVFFYMGNAVCAVNDAEQTYRLSHAGVTTKNKFGEEVFPKTSTQTLLNYRDFFTTDGYQEAEPLDSIRPARDWKKHEEEYKAMKEAKANGTYQPVKRGKSKISAALAEALRQQGIDIASLIEQVEGEHTYASSDLSEDYAGRELPTYEEAVLPLAVHGSLAIKLIEGKKEAKKSRKRKAA